MSLQAKLIKVGNSTGLTIPASVLKAVDATSGDVVEFEIKRVLKGVRAGWGDPVMWRGADESPILLDDAPVNDFDNEDWEW